MNHLLEKLIAARESWIEAGKYRFKIRRPTEMQLIQLRRGDQFEIGLDVIKRFVVDWDKVTEADLIPSGAADAVAFNADIYGAWIEDQPELWQAIADGIFAAIKSAEQKQADSKKN